LRLLPPVREEFGSPFSSIGEVISEWPEEDQQKMYDVAKEVIGEEVGPGKFTLEQQKKFYDTTVAMTLEERVKYLSLPGMVLW